MRLSAEVRTSPSVATALTTEPEPLVTPYSDDCSEASADFRAPAWVLH